MHIRAQQAYHNASFDPFGSPSYGGGSRSSDSTSDSGAPKARVTSRDVGFSVGKFGLRYTSKDVSFDPQDIQNLQTRKQDFEREFASVREIEELRRRTASFIPPSDAAPGEGTSMRRGLLTYARNASPQSYAQPKQRQLLATV